MGAKEISIALGGVPHFGELEIEFHRQYTRPKSYKRYAAGKLKKEGAVGPPDLPERVLATIYHFKHRLGIFTSNDDSAERWQIWIFSTERKERHRFNELFLEEVLPRFCEWLTANTGINGEFRSDSIRAIWSVEKEIIRFETSSKPLGYSD